MATSILFVDGELYLAWTSVVVGAIVVALIALSTVLLRVRTRKWGKRAYWIAPLPWLAVLITGFLLALANSPNSGPPKGLSANRLGGSDSSLARLRAL
jgi:amino acid transporter